MTWAFLFSYFYIKHVVDLFLTSTKPPLIWLLSLNISKLLFSKKSPRIFWLFPSPAITLHSFSGSFSTEYKFIKFVCVCITYKYQRSSAFYGNFFHLLLGFKIYIKTCTFTSNLSENQSYMQPPSTKSHSG